MSAEPATGPGERAPRPPLLLLATTIGPVTVALEAGLVVSLRAADPGAPGADNGPGIVDLAALLGVDAALVAPEARVAELDLDGERLRVRLGRRVELRSVPWHAVDPLPAMLAGVGDLFLGLALLDGRYLFLLDPDRLRDRAPTVFRSNVEPAHA